MTITRKLLIASALLAIAATGTVAKAQAQSPQAPMMGNNMMVWGPGMMGNSYGVMGPGMMGYGDMGRG